jgi:hypothetical protein
MPASLRHAFRSSAIALAIATPSLLAQEPAPRAPAPVRVCSGGDVALGTNLDTRWAAVKGVRPFPDANALVQPLIPLFADADLALLNVEGAIGAGPAPQKCSRRSNLCFAIRQPIGTENALRAVAPQAAVVGNLANNHAPQAARCGDLRHGRRHGRDGCRHRRGGHNRSARLQRLE